MVSINEITQDLLNIIRGSNISQSEPISKRQLIDWVNYYRALFMRRDQEKNKTVSPDYVQELNGLELEVENESGNSSVKSPYSLLKTVKEIPSTINFNSGQGFTFVGTLEGDEIQGVSQQRSRWQEHTKYTPSEPVWFSKNNHIYIKQDTILTYITARGAFEDPLEVMVLNGEDPMTTRYPIPYNLVSAIKDEILRRELNIMASAPTDNVNDSKNEEYGVTLQG